MRLLTCYSDLESIETVWLTDISNAISHGPKKPVSPTDSPDEACFLSQCHLSPYGSAEFLALSRSDFGWGILSGVTGEHRPKFGDLIVNLALLRLEAFDGSGDDFLGEFWWHCGFPSE